jgi:proteic killer suppression protein
MRKPPNPAAAVECDGLHPSRGTVAPAYDLRPDQRRRQRGTPLAVVTLAVINVSRYYRPRVIKTFKCADTRALSNGERVKRFVNVAAVARRKLRQLEIADRLDDLRVPPGNRLEALTGDREGQHSIRVNDQYRVCFRWTPGGAEDVEIVDYH